MVPKLTLGVSNKQLNCGFTFTDCFEFLSLRNIMMTITNHLSGFNSRRTRGHRSNRVLPNPREITTKVTTTNVVLNYEGVSAHIMQWGQFIAHEFTQLSEVQGKLLNCIPFFLEIMAFKCQRVIANWAYQEIMEKWKVSITPLFIYLNLFIMVPLH